MKQKAPPLKMKEEHFRISSKNLYKAIKENPKLQHEIGLSDMEVLKLKKGKTPKNFIWHHHQDPGKIQLVDKIIHQKTGHTGGYKIWGPES